MILLHGLGGMGKTRLLLSLSSAVPEGTLVWYIHTEAESIERDLTMLDRNGQHVIVVDGAHRFAPLPRLREALVNPELSGKVKLVLATRGVFKKTVLYQLGSFPGDQICEIGLEALPNADIDSLLQNPPHAIPEQALRHALVRIAEGSPLFAGIGARLVFWWAGTGAMRKRSHPTGRQPSNAVGKRLSAISRSFDQQPWKAPSTTST